MEIKCNYCQSNKVVKNGFTATDKQRYLCKSCHKRFITNYSYNAYRKDINEQIVKFTKEGVGIRGTARILRISTTTLLKRILHIAREIKLPPIVQHQTYEVDELRIYIGSKKHPTWIVYALDRATKTPVCFKVGRRNKKNLKVVIDTLLLAKAKKKYTDKLPLYKSLIAKEFHSTKFRATNHIERNHLTLRTHLKRLNRRTLCFSRSLLILTAILKIYFWQ